MPVGIDADALVLAIAADVREARRCRNAIAAEFTCLGAAVPAAQLVVSELVTNAVLHGLPPLGMRAFADDTGVRFEVTDHNSSLGTPNSGSRGLGIVEELSTAWDVEYDARSKTVWAHVGRA